MIFLFIRQLAHFISRKFLYIFIIICASLTPSSLAFYPNKLPCIGLFCEELNGEPSGLRCSACEDCVTKQLRFCVHNSSSCACMERIPSDCYAHRDSTHRTQKRICYNPGISYLDLPDFSVDNKNALSVIIGRFWEAGEDGQHFRNLTLHSYFTAKDLSDCVGHDNFSSARVMGNLTCYLRFKVPMPTLDYVSNDNYYYDDGTDPTFNFDRSMFDELSPVYFWYVVRARKHFHLADNVTIFFEYPLRSRNITYLIAEDRFIREDKRVTRRVKEAAIGNSDDDILSTHNELPNAGIAEVEAELGETKERLYLFNGTLSQNALKKHFLLGIILCLIILLVPAVLCGLSAWCCCSFYPKKENFFQVIDRSRRDSSSGNRLVCQASWESEKAS